MILPKVGNLFFYLRSFFSPTGKKFFFTRGKTWKGKVEKSEDIQCKKKQNKMDKIFPIYKFLCIFAAI